MTSVIWNNKHTHNSNQLPKKTLDCITSITILLRAHFFAFNNQLHFDL